MEPGARPYVGKLYVADISVPGAIYRRLGIVTNALFASSDIVALINGDGTIGA